MNQVNLLGQVWVGDEDDDDDDMDDKYGDGQRYGESPLVTVTRMIMIMTGMMMITTRMMMTI